MVVIGLTGGIAMGKSTVAKQFALCGAKVLSSDTVVHALLAPGGAAVSEVARVFPSAVSHGNVSRETLAKIVFADANSLSTLEAILHPLVEHAQEQWLHAQARLGVRLAVLDIPLLFETGAEQRVDCTVTVTAPAFLQKQRALRRPGMTEEKHHSILARQLPDRERRARADFVIETGLGRAHSMCQIHEIIHIVRT